MAGLEEARGVVVVVGIWDLRDAGPWSWSCLLRDCGPLVAGRDFAKAEVRRSRLACPRRLAFSAEWAPLSGGPDRVSCVFSGNPGPLGALCTPHRPCTGTGLALVRSITAAIMTYRGSAVSRASERLGIEPPSSSKGHLLPLFSQGLYSLHSRLAEAPRSQLRMTSSSAANLSCKNFLPGFLFLQPPRLVG